MNRGKRFQTGRLRKFKHHSFTKQKFIAMKKHLFFPLLLAFASVSVLTNTACNKECDDDLNYAKITKIVVKSFPSTKPDGMPWDPSSVSDLFVRLRYSNGDIFYESDYKPSSSPFAEHAFNMSGPDVNLFPNTYKLSLHDSDSSDKQTFENIGSLSFAISATDEVNPIVLSENGISAEVYLEYIH